MTKFIHLRVHSAYSLAEGAVTIKNLIKLCRKYKMPAVGIADTSNLFGALEFAIAASEAGIQPIVGCQVYLQTLPTDIPPDRKGEPDKLVLIAQTEEGWTNLMYLVTQSFLDAQPGEKPQIPLSLLSTHASGLIILTGAHEGTLARLIAENKRTEAEAFLKTLHDIVGDRLYIELMRTGVDLQDQIEPTLIDLAYAHNIPLVATNDVYFDYEKMHAAHDALLCIASGSYINSSDRRTVTPEHYLKSPADMVTLFQDIPEALQNTVAIAQRCSFMPSANKPILPPFPTASGCTEEEELRRMAVDGLEHRLSNQVYPLAETPQQREEFKTQYTTRLDYELRVIVEMGFPGYFLIVADFIQWAKSQSIPVGPGRGSGAGSLVAWALTITDIDPIRFGLLFERFLNPERVSMPDFDIDFCQERRDEVIKYVCSKYGQDHVAHIITFGKLQARAVLRDVGRVLQMAYGHVDKICKLVPNNPADPVTLDKAIELEPLLKEARDSDPQVAQLIDIGLQLEGLYRHASTHAAGVVIGDRPLYQLIPLYKDDRSDLYVTQYSMKYVELAGLLKFDFLGLKTLTVIEQCCALIRKTGQPINMSTVSLEDQKTFDLLCRVETVGIFQLESMGMRDVVRKLKPDRFEDLIALVALYRPGPMDDIPRYLACKHGEEAVTYLHPSLEPILEATYGVMVYQEQVMKIAQDLGGYTLGSADLLRRAMGKKIKSEMNAQRAKFTEGAHKNGIGEKVATQIFDQMAKFAGYGFNKSHSAPYALLAYQTAYLKANHPLEFYAASMTYDMHNTDKINVFRQDMTRMGIKLLPPDINTSHVEFMVEGDAIRYALTGVKGVGENTVEAIVDERQKNGPFKNLEDLANRLDNKTLNKRTIELMAAGGVFDSLSPNRHQIFSGAEAILRQAAVAHVERHTTQQSLFAFAGESATPSLNLPAMRDWGPMERLQKEFESIGFFISAHPLDVWKSSLERMGVISSAALPLQNDGAHLKLAGVVVLKKEMTSKKNGKKYAFLTLSDSEGVFEATVFSEVLSKAREYIEPGMAVYITVSYQRDAEGEGFRLTTQDLLPLEGTLNQQMRSLRVVVDHRTCPHALKDILSDIGPGKIRICLHIHPGDTPPVELHLPDSYAITADVRSRFLSLEGVLRVEEG